MKNRLDLAKRLLSRDGFILVQCDDNEQAYLKVLMDSVFGEQNFINVISVRTKVGGVTGSSAGKSLKDELEYINLFAKDRSSESANLTPTYVDTDLEEYIQSYKDSGKSWKYTSVLTKLEGRVLLEEDEVRGERLYGYSHVESKSVKAFAKQEGITEGEVYAKFAERIFRTTNAQSSVRARVMGQASQYDFEMIGLEYTPSKGKNASKKIEVLYKGKQQNMMMFLSDAVSMRDGKYVYQDRVGTLWSDIQYNNLAKEGEVSFLNGKKPEALIQRVLDLTTEPGDLVLDFFLGSGSTAAVAHKMGRRYLGVEQLDYITSVTVPRLEKVLAGEQSGISRAQNWQGGGSFVYVELAEQGEKLMVELQEAGSANEVQRVLQKATAQGLLRTSVLPSDLKSNENEFDELSLIDQKNVVAELIDKNRLYVNASGIEDDDLELDLADIAFTKSFYEVGTK
ncbi:hypothetical protein KaCgl_00070 [Corynebacterium glutamicum]|nr:hypothetical protein KaCgl_00070 [Corynebacterium glutamicum]